MDAILRDIRYGFRSLIKSPGLTLVATLALTLGIGLTTVMFSMVYGVILKSLPYANGDRIVEVRRNNKARGFTNLAVPISDYADFKNQQHSLAPIAAYYSGTVNVSGKGQAERYAGSFVTASTFDVTGVQPILGRTLRPGEDSPAGEKVAVISYALWKSEFGGSPGALGAVLRANGVPYTVVGVMPEGYDFPDNARIWLPLQMDPVATKRGDGTWLTVAGVRKPGVTLAQATSDFSAIATRLQHQYQATNDGIDAEVEPFIDAEIGPQPRQLLYTMLGAVFFVLLIACANVANLLLDRAAHRTREVGIRTALGATRAAVVRQFLTEALVLSLGGAVFGSVAAYAGITEFNRVIYASADIPWFIDVRLNGPVLAFAIGMAALAALLSGLLPAIQSSRTDINEVLKDESRGSSSLRIGRMSRVLVIVEIALSCGLLVAAGLTIKSVTNLQTMNPGFRTSHIFTARVGFPAEYTDTVMQRQFFERLRDRLETIPGVRSAALTSGLPGVQSNDGSFEVEGAAYTTDNDVPNARNYSVSPRFFETFAIRVDQGRGISASDRADAPPVVVVNQAFADKFLRGRDVLGRRIRQGGRDSTQPWMTVIGLVPNTFTGDQNEPRAPAYFVPLSQHSANFVSMAALTDGPPMDITPQVRAAVAALNPDLPIYWTYPMTEAMARQVWFIRVFGTMFMLFGFVALFLAAIGLYAVMSFSVSRRVREMGIRMALGAQAGDVVRIIVRQGVLQIAIGVVAGLAFAATLAQFLVVVLFQVQPRDPLIFGGVAVVLGLTGMVACLVPALRATAVDPLTALRTD
ncbi:MAG TPA: ABC transporter permease [Gemmatimonadaceae bacterium]|nr:ABC transporter permease [Gemmatimonadaceae bacterium]